MRTLHICKACGDEYPCGMFDDPNICQQCCRNEIVSGSGALTVGAVKRLASPPPLPVLCDGCHNAAPQLIVLNGKQYCPTCREKIIAFPAINWGAVL